MNTRKINFPKEWSIVINTKQWKIGKIMVVLKDKLWIIEK